MITMFGLSLWLKLNNNFYQIQPEKGVIWLQHLLYITYIIYNVLVLTFTRISFMPTIRIWSFLPPNCINWKYDMI